MTQWLGEDTGDMRAGEQGHELPLVYWLVCTEKRLEIPTPSHECTMAHRCTDKLCKKQIHSGTYLHLSTHTTSYLQSEQNYKRLLCGDLVGGQVLPVCLGIYKVKWWSSTDSCNSLPWNSHKWFWAFGRSLLLKMHLHQRMSWSTTFFLIFALARKAMIELI